MLSTKTIFLIGVIAGIMSMAMGGIIIVSPISDFLKIVVLIIGGVVFMGLPQSYINGKVELPYLGKVIVPDHMNTPMRKKKIWSIGLGCIFPFPYLYLSLYIVVENITSMGKPTSLKAFLFCNGVMGKSETC